MDYRIVVDSSANMNSFSGVDFDSVPLKITTDEREFVDDTTLELDEMLQYLESYKGRSGTSCPNVGEWKAAFGQAKYVFTIAITSNLSGAYNASVQAGQVYMEENPDRRVCNLDSLSTGPEMVLIAQKLRELIHEGLDFDTIEKRIREYMTRTHLLFSLESLNNLARNGRVSPLVAKAAGLLGIRIVGKASDVGTLQQMHKCRGEMKALQTIVAEMTKMAYQGGKVCISHCRNPRAAEELSRQVLHLWPNADLEVTECGGLCSFYAERGGILVGFEG